jgi:hypothetical protein
MIAKWCFIGCIVGMIILSTLAGLMYYAFHVSGHALKIYADVCGIVASILILFQWVPQIVKVYKEKVII